MSQAFDPKIAAGYGAFVEAVYLMYEGDRRNPTPPPQGVAAGYDVVGWIQMADFFFGMLPRCFYGIIAQDTAHPRSFVVAIRGTSNVAEWWDIAHISSIPFTKVPDAGVVAEGFFRIYETLEVIERSTDPQKRGARQSLRDEGGFANQIASLVQRHSRAALERRGDAVVGLMPNSTVIVAGHSLGAALATMYALDNAVNHKIDNPMLFTFASPQVGNHEFVAAFNDLKLTSWRIVNSEDIVPQVPSQLFGYRHIDAFQVVNSSGKVQPTLGCRHALRTYISLLDPSMEPGSGCALNDDLGRAAWITQGEPPSVASLEPSPARPSGIGTHVDSPGAGRADVTANVSREGPT